MFGLQVTTNNSIAATSERTAGGARIGRICVSVVTSLNAHLKDTITAARRRAGAQASVTVFCVSVVAEFSRLDDPVTALCRATVVTIIGRVIIAIIATLTGTNNPVTAACRNAGTQAGVLVVYVAVVARLITRITQLKVSTKDAVATTRSNAAG